MKPIYLDHAATTPVHPAAAAVYGETMAAVFGNPSSIHRFGRDARKHLEDARKILAESIGASPAEIIFTSGGTEADNMAVLGTAAAMRNNGNHIITTNIEHPAVLRACEKLESEGYIVDYVPANEYGQITARQIEQLLTDQTILVSVMYGNNEVGSIQPIQQIGALLQNHQAVFHTDAVQAYGMNSFSVQELGVDLLSVTAHKLNGPKGIGFLYQRKGEKTESLLVGGGQEKKRRAGTENVPAAVSFARAAQIARTEMDKNRELYKKYAAIMTNIWKEQQIAFTINAGQDNSLPHILNVSFDGTDIETLLVNLDMAGIAASSGSACSAGTVEPSHVLAAMYGKDAAACRNSVRFSFGLGLNEEWIKEASIEIAAIVKRLAN